jgi:hypothetical protein
MIKWVLIVWITTQYHVTMPLEIGGYESYDKCVEESVDYKNKHISKDKSYEVHTVCKPETKY